MARGIGIDLLRIAFAAWLLTSAICQFRFGWVTRLRGWDVFNLIPSWTFFAPNPAMHDLHLLYRDRFESGAVSDWREVPRPVCPRLVYPLWNPGRRHNKALFDIMKHLGEEATARRDEPRGVTLSLPYIALLNHVSELPRCDRGAMTQFLLMRSAKTASPGTSAVFVSGMHALPG